MRRCAQAPEIFHRAPSSAPALQMFCKLEGPPINLALAASRDCGDLGDGILDRALVERGAQRVIELGVAHDRIALCRRSNYHDKLAAGCEGIGIACKFSNEAASDVLVQLGHLATDRRFAIAKSGGK